MSSNVVGRAVVRVDGEVDQSSTRSAADEFERIMSSGGQAAADNIEESMVQIEFPGELGGFNEALDTAAGTAREFGGGFGDLVTAMDTFGVTSSDAGAKVAQSFEQIEAATQLFGGISDILNTTKAAFTAVTGATQATSVAQGALNAVMALNPIFLVVAAVGALVAAFVIAYKRSETFRKIVDAAFGAIRETVATVIRFVGGIVKRTWEALTTATTSLSTALQRTWTTIKTAVTATVEAIVTFITTSFTSARASVGKIVDGIKSKVTGTFTAIKTAVTTVWTAIKNAVLNAVRTVRDTIGGVLTSIKDKVKTAFDNVKSAVENAWDDAVDAVDDAIGDVLNYVSDLPSDIINELGDLSQTLVQGGKDLIGGLASGITAAASSAYEAARDALGPIGDLLPGSPVKDGPLTVLNKGYAGGQIAKMIADGMRDGIDDVAAAGRDLSAAAVAPVNANGNTSMSVNSGGSAGRVGWSRSQYGTTIHNVNVTAYSDRFNLRDVENALALRGLV